MNIRRSWICKSSLFNLPNVRISGNVRVQVDVVGVHVVLHDVLVDPRNGRAANVVLRKAEQPVDLRVPADGAVVGVVLNVQTCADGYCPFIRCFI